MPNGTYKRRALVVEGGALRGAFAVGVLRTIYDHGGPDAFDGIFAVSAGVFASTFYAASQVDTMENTWRNLVHGNQMVSYWHPLKGKPILDLDHLIEIFKDERSYLDLDRVMAAKPHLTYVLTDFATGQPVYVSAKSPKIFDLMRASASLPIAYPLPVFVDGHPYCDGGISDSIPIERAISEGYSEILAILTRPEGYLEQPSWFWKLLIHWVLRRSPPIWEAFLRRPECYNRSLRLLKSPPLGVKIHFIRPNSINVTRLERDRESLISAIEHGKALAREYLERSDSILNQSLSYRR